MSSWDGFVDLDEKQQARYLLDEATLAWQSLVGFKEIKSKVQNYLNLGYRICQGEFDQLESLIQFLEDPKMKDDFGSFYEQIKHDDKAAACLDLASYACAFVCRIAAQKVGLTPLPDPVLEAVPEIYEYYQSRSEFLGLQN